MENHEDNAKETPNRYKDDPVQETKSKLIFAAIVFGGMLIAKLLGY